MRPFLRRVWAFRRAASLYALLLLGGWLLGDAIRDFVIPDMRPMNEPTVHRIVMAALILFVLTSAIPFVPGAEIGLGLLVVFGAKAAPMVYAGMVGALMLSYCIARLVPPDRLVRALRWLGFIRAADFLTDIDKSGSGERMNALVDRVPSTFGKRLLRNRYLLLAISINTPGNTLIGGGGGLAFMAGISGIYGFWPYLAIVLCSVAPVPLFFALT